MLQGKNLILATKKYAKEDRKKSWRLLFITLFLLLAANGGAIVNVHIVPQIICAVLAALLSIRMFMFYHDYLHKAILQHSGFAKIFFTLYGMFLLAPTSIWKRSHDYHHGHNSKLYTSSIGSFPLATKQNFLSASTLDRTLYLFARHPLTILLGYFFIFLWGMCISSLIKNPGRHFDSLLAIIFHASIGGAIFLIFGGQGFVIGFLFPAVLRHAIGAYLFYAQHNFPSATFKLKEEWNYIHAALHSSSYMKMSKVMHWFTGNIGYHHIHHINSRIPFYNLPRVFRDMEEFRHPGITSLLPWDIYQCLRIKVWDPDEGKMVGLKEVYA